VVHAKNDRGEGFDRDRQAVLRKGGHGERMIRLGLFPEMGIGSVLGILEGLYLCDSCADNEREARSILGIDGLTSAARLGALALLPILFSAGYGVLASLALNLIMGRVPESSPDLEKRAITEVRGVESCGQSRVLPPQGSRAIPDY